MRIIYWMSDVCSSELGGRIGEALIIRAEVAPSELSEAVWAHFPDQDHIVVGTGRCFVVRKFGREKVKRVRQRWKPAIAKDVGAVKGRSEEHTSELQSLMRISYAVFCLKKKKSE